MMESSRLMEIETNCETYAVAFATNGEYLVSGDNEAVRLWRTQDGTQMMRMAAEKVRCLAVSTDSKWIAAGTAWGDFFVWNANTYEQVFSHLKEALVGAIDGVDFSPDATRLVTASRYSGTADVWDIASGKRVLGPLHHVDDVVAVKFLSPSDLIATATQFSVKAYDSNDGSLLADIPVGVTPYFNRGLLWSDDQLYILSGNKIQRVESLTPAAPPVVSGSWTVPDTNGLSSIALLKNGGFIACSTNQNVTFWDTLTYTNFGFIEHTEYVRSIAFSSDDRLFAIAGGQNITIHSPSRVIAKMTHSSPDAAPADSFKPSPSSKSASSSASSSTSASPFLVQLPSPHPIEMAAEKKLKMDYLATLGPSSEGSTESRSASVAHTDQSLEPHYAATLAQTPTARPRATDNISRRVSAEFYWDDLTDQITRDGNDPVASGGFADIYRGTLQEDREFTIVAIKAIKTYSGEDGDFVKKEKRLWREIKVWLNLRHINVLPLLGTAMGFGRFPAMVCPWVENGSLTSYLKDHHDGLTEVEVLCLLDDVASGLHYLHSRSVVHGDLSGSNVLIREEGGACIADFGLSMLLNELGGSTFTTSFHARCTLRWAAPELLDLEVREDGPEGEPLRSEPTTQSDVYSFGGIMLQILSGKMPYHYYTRDVQVIHAVSIGMTPKRPNSLLVTESRWAFIRRCWSMARSRPSSEDIVEFTKKELASASAP